MSTISLGMIVRNEGRTLERCLESVKDHVDEIVIGLAGQSTDDTAQIARKYTDKVFDIEWTDDFSSARNRVLQEVTGEYFLWLDGDDELVVEGPSLHELIASHPEVEAFYWGYDYAQDENDNCVCYLVRERLVKLSAGWSWSGKVHEVLLGRPDHTRLLVDSVLTRHHKPADKHDPRRNLEILYQQLAEQEPNPDPRILSYLGSENATHGDIKEAIVHWQRFVAVSGWDEEKYQAQHRIADCWRALGDSERARQADFAAIRIRPDWPDAYLGLAETAYRSGQWNECIEWTKSAGTKSYPRTMLILNPRDYDYDPLLILGLAYTQLQDYEIALDNFRKAYAIRPEPGLALQIQIIEEEDRLHKVVTQSVRVWEELVKHDEWLKARAFVESLPHSIMMTPPIQDIRIRTFQNTGHVDNPELMEQFYLNNPAWEPMPDDKILSAEWLRYPRLQFALRTARAIRAKNILDLGCSDGFISLPLARELHNVQVTGIDIDPRCIKLANERVARFSQPLVEFLPGDINTYRPDIERFYDLALVFEVLEHVVDIDDTLSKIEKMARHIAITTPYLAWNQGRTDEWKQPGLKPHIRIFDLDDMERMLAPRGRIRDLYKQPHGSTGWIFADYEAVEFKAAKKVVIAALGTLESWSPRTLEAEGLGGSETAVVKVSEELAKLGHDVTVYTNTDSPGYHNWVRYREQERYIPQVRSDLFVAWRAPELIDHNPNAAVKVLWMHDVDAGDRLTATRAAGFDHIIVLSEWHRDYMKERYPFLRDEQFLVLGNGVDLERFTGVEEREPHRVIYASSPDRGLDVILEGIWPEVVKAVPDAELHVYYGWTSFNKAAEHFPQLKDFKAKISNLLDRSQNVIQHGRIPQDKLAREFMRSSFWLYPTYFSETYCITAIEAQLAGCIPVTNQLAALKETVQSGIFINGDPREPEVQSAFVSQLVEWMEKTNLDSYRKQVVKRTPHLSWEEVAKVWESLWLEAADVRLESSPRNGQIVRLSDYAPHEEAGSSDLVPDVPGVSSGQDLSC